MRSWESVASGTRLWRLTVVIQTVVTLIIGIAQAFWTFQLLSRNAHLANDPAALEALTQRTMVLAVILSVMGLALSGVLIVVGRRWQAGPAVPSASGKAQAYAVMAVISLALQVVVLLVTFTSADGDPGFLSKIAGFLTVAMLFTAFSMHAGYLNALGSPVAELASNLSRALIFLFLGAVFAVILATSQSIIVGLLGLALLICGIIWFVYFLVFMGRAAATYDQGGQLSADVFD